MVKAPDALKITSCCVYGIHYRETYGKFASSTGLPSSELYRLSVNPQSINLCVQQSIR
jgi:hypothetical protein